MQTVYVIIKRGVIIEAYADHETDLVVLDYDTHDEEMTKELDAELENIQKNNKIVEIY